MRIRLSASSYYTANDQREIKTQIIFAVYSFLFAPSPQICPSIRSNLCSLGRLEQPLCCSFCHTLWFASIILYRCIKSHTLILRSSYTCPLLYTSYLWSEICPQLNLLVVLSSLFFLVTRLLSVIRSEKCKKTNEKADFIGKNTEFSAVAIGVTLALNYSHLHRME